MNAGASSLNVGIVGCGLIGCKRATAINNDRLIGFYDINTSLCNDIANKFNTKPFESLNSLLIQDLDAVIVAVPHNELAEIACAALNSGSHVLIEKPGGISSEEIDKINSIATNANKKVKVGFNHRFYPGIERAVKESISGKHGKVMFARARYGHGGRVGYEREWRMDRLISGGGELIDQGMHLIDLSYGLFGALPLNIALLKTNFWETDVEDNVIFVLSDDSRSGPWFLAHTSWSEWKNMFSLEIYCQEAKFQIEGLTGSYGTQRLTIYSMKPEMGPPDVEHINFPDNDVSWLREWDSFRNAIIKENNHVIGGLDCARYAWEMVEAAYNRYAQSDN